jgi:hypothetical protein
VSLTEDVARFVVDTPLDQLPPVRGGAPGQALHPGRQRLAAVGGSLVMASAPRAGTRLLAKVALVPTRSELSILRRLARLPAPLERRFPRIGDVFGEQGSVNQRQDRTLPRVRPAPDDSVSIGEPGHPPVIRRINPLGFSCSQSRIPYPCSGSSRGPHVARASDGWNSVEGPQSSPNAVGQRSALPAQDTGFEEFLARGVFERYFRCEHFQAAVLTPSRRRLEHLCRAVRGDAAVAPGRLPVCYLRHARPGRVPEHRLGERWQPPDGIAVAGRRG